MVTYTINTGRPGDVAMPRQERTLAQAKMMYRVWLLECHRIGNTYEESWLDVTLANGDERRYKPGQSMPTLRLVYPTDKVPRP